MLSAVQVERNERPAGKPGKGGKIAGTGMGPGGWEGCAGLTRAADPAPAELAYARR